MKANELRIGNWVRWNYEESSEGNVYPVEYGYELDDIKNNPNIVKPIPLTEEWLERFGWVKSKDRSHFWHDSNLSLWFNDNGLFIESVGGKLYIKHLHQLQNLYFALTYEELQTDETNQKVNQ